MQRDSHAAGRARKPGLNSGTRLRGRSRKKRKASNCPTYDPKFGAKNRAKCLRDTAGEKGTRGPQPAPGGQARGSHARYSPVFWRQTRCEKERSEGLRHLYTALPPLGEKGGASTRHDFPSLPRATSTRHPSERRPLPPLSGDRGRCAFSLLKGTRRLAHAPLDPGDDESEGWEAGTRDPWILG